jgi:hypothetical protein
MHHRIAVLVAVLLVLTACGGGGGETPALDEAGQAAAGELTATLEDLGMADVAVYIGGGRADLACWAERIVDGLGVEKTGPLTAAADDIDLQDAMAALSLGDLNRVADGLSACIDVASAAEELESYGLDSGQADCVADKVHERGRFRDVFAALVTDDEETIDEVLGRVASACGIDVEE